MTAAHPSFHNWSTLLTRPATTAQKPAAGRVMLLLIKTSTDVMTAEHWLSTVTSCSTRLGPATAALCLAAVLHKQYSPVPAVMLQYCCMRCMLCTAPGKCHPLLWRICYFVISIFCRLAAADRRRRSWPTLGCYPCRGWGSECEHRDLYRRSGNEFSWKASMRKRLGGSVSKRSLILPFGYGQVSRFHDDLLCWNTKH